MRYKQILFIFSLLIWCSCSTLSFLPREGGAAKFNLATVEYVDSQVDAQSAELINMIMGEVEPIIDSLLIEDRNKISRIEDLLAEQEERMASLSVSVDSTYASMSAVASKLLADISGVKRTTSDLQLLSNQLSERMNTLSKEALLELNKILEAYLQEPAPTDEE